MRTVMLHIGQTLPAGAAVLMLAACGGMSTPTAPADAAAATKSIAAGAAAATSSVTVRGAVVDSANRPLANANIECLGDVHCTGPNVQVIAEGHEHRVAQTDANGFYEMVAASGSGGGFLMNANGRGYQVEWRQVEWPDPACSSDQPHCTITVDFKLTSLAD